MRLRSNRSSGAARPSRTVCRNTPSRCTNGQTSNSDCFSSGANTCSEPGRPSNRLARRSTRGSGSFLNRRSNRRLFNRRRSNPTPNPAPPVNNVAPRPTVDTPTPPVNNATPAPPVNNAIPTPPVDAPTPHNTDKRINGVMVSESETYGNQITGWRQTREGNCAAVAAIKAAVDRYDDKVFSNVERTDGGYAITQRDGYKLNLSDAELKMATERSYFKGSNEKALKNANFLYATMAKRALEGREEGSRTYASAIRSLNNGDSPYESAEFLGLKDYYTKVNPRTLDGQDSIVGWNGSHAINVDKDMNGNYTSDNYGRAKRFNGTDTRGARLRWAYSFNPLAAE